MKYMNWLIYIAEIGLNLYILPYFNILPIYIQFMFITFLASFTEILPLFMIVYHMLLNNNFNILYIILFIISSTCGFVVSEIIIFTAMKQIPLKNNNRYINTLLKIMLRFPYTSFIIYRIIPYARSIAIKIISYSYNLHQFIKVSLISSITSSILMLGYMIVSNIYVH